MVRALFMLASDLENPKNHIIAFSPWPPLVVASSLHFAPGHRPLSLLILGLVPGVNSALGSSLECNIF